MIFCPICASELDMFDGTLGCPEDETHNLATDTPEFCRDHGMPVKSCPGCAAERAEDMDR